MTIWELAAIPGDLLLLGVLIAALCLTADWLLAQPWKRRAGDQPVPGADQGVTWARPPAPGAVSPASTPAPGSRHGGISYSVRAWRCGRIRVWDADGHVTYKEDCHCPDPWDTAIERLINDARN